MPTPPWASTFPDLCPTASLSSARYGAFADLCRRRFCSHSSCYSSYLGLTTTMRRLPDCRIINLVGFNLCWTTRLVFSARKYEAVSPLLRDLHCTLATNATADRVQAGSAQCSVLTYHCLHLTAPLYLADELHRVADIDTWRHLRLASTSTVVVLPMRHSTIGDRLFLVAVLRVWKSLTSRVTSSTSLAVFRRRLK